MKRLIAVFVVVLFSAVFLTGCVSNADTGAAGKSGKDVVFGALSKQSNLSSIEIPYSGSLNAAGGGITFNMPMTLHLYRSGSSQVVDGKMTYFSVTSESKTFKLGGKQYVCALTLGAWSCRQSESSLVSELFMSKDQLQKFVDKGVVSFGSAKEKTVLGRACDAVRITLNMSRITPEDFGYDSTGQVFTGYTRYAYTPCFDRETGMELSSELDAEAKYSFPTGPALMNVSGVVAATGFWPNAVVAASLFELPAQPGAGTTSTTGNGNGNNEPLGLPKQQADPFSTVTHAYVWSTTKNWDADAEDDGLVIYPELLNARDNKVSFYNARLTVDIELWVNSYDSDYNVAKRLVFNGTGLASSSDDYFNVSFGQILTTSNEEYGDLFVRVHVPNGNAYEARDSSVRIRPYESSSGYYD